MKSIDVSVGQVPGLLSRRNWNDAGGLRPRRQDSVSLIWFSGGDDESLPHAIAIDESRFIEVISVLTAHSEALTPLTAYVRLIRTHEIPELASSFVPAALDRSRILTAVGVTIAEAMLQRGLSDPPVEVPLAACLKTVSWSIGRLVLRPRSTSYIDLAARWTSVWQSLRDDELRVSASELIEVWGALASDMIPRPELPFGNDAREIALVVTECKGDIDAIWERLGGFSSVAQRYRLKTNQSREDRYQVLNRATRELLASGRVREPIGSALLGLYAAACVDFSFAAIGLLDRSAPNVSRLWAGLFAGLARTFGGGRDSSGLDSRLETLFEAESIATERTTADIGFEELAMIMRSTAARFSDFRLKIQSEIAVELIPGIVSSFVLNGKRTVRRREQNRPRERELAEILQRLQEATDLLRRVMPYD